MFTFENSGNVSWPTNDFKDSNGSLNLKKMLSQNTVMTPMGWLPEPGNLSHKIANSFLIKTSPSENPKRETQ